MATSALPELLALSSADGVSLAKVALLGAGILAALLVVRLLLAVKAYARVSAGLSSVPMAPGYNPILGHVIGLVMCALGPPNQRKGAWDLMEDWIKATGGPIVRFRILGTQGVAVSDPEALKRIFQTRQKVYKKELELSYKPFLPILGTGLVTSEGELWQKQRLLIGPALRTDILDDIIGIAKNATDRLCQKLEPHRGTGVAVDVEEEFRLLTLQVIGEAVLSLPPSECDEVFPQLYLPVMQEANRRVLLPFRRFLPTPEWFRFHSRMAQLNRFLIGKCRERRQQRLAGTRKGRTDILDRIMDSIEETGTKWDNALEVQLCYELKTFLLAGHETSAAMLTWSVMELANAPPLMQRVLAEADVAFGAEEAEPPRRAVDAMTFTLSVLKEALRKYSVVPVVTRIIAEDDELCGRKVPAGAMVVCHLQGAHNLYKEPRKFNPDRFMPGGEYEQFDESIRPYMFLPFIQGPRNCLGQHLALLESRVVLALLAKRFRMRLEDPSHAGERHPTVIPVGPVEGLRVFLD